MINEISNEVYETALKNMDNKLIMDAACSSFKKSIDKDELHRCKLIALWEAMIHWNPEGRKFTSFLYQKVRWECLKVVKKQKFHKGVALKTDVKSHYHTTYMGEIIESLPSDLQDILVKRYTHGMTLREISLIYGFCHETIRRKIHRAIKILQNT